VVGVAGSMPVHGIGTAMFLIRVGVKDVVLKIFNCLLCHGEEGFNLLSVSQMIRNKQNSLTFGAHSGLQIMQNGQVVNIPLNENDGLFEIVGRPINAKDKRLGSLLSYELTLESDPVLYREDDEYTTTLIMKSPSKLGKWRRKVLWMGMKSITTVDYDENLKDFCRTYFSPLSQTQTRKTYHVDEDADMQDLSIRYMGVGRDRLAQTLKRSRGLTTATKDGRTAKIPPHNFPQGKWAAGKTPRVSKDKVKFLHRAAIAEVCFTDTFEVDDKVHRYGQAFVCYRTRYGDIIPIKSRTKVGWAFGEFCCRHFVPKILVRDNIAENIGGELAKECHNRGVKSAFICPYVPEQDQAEGYLGRVTTMASFAMVYAGAPIYMWIWCIQCAVFINNITATYYSKEKVWAIPYELMHGEPYPDSSIVVPFGCAALVLLNKDEREKFKPRCAMMIFIHYAMQHPLYTYALYSPKSKRVLFRQDVIFLTNVFPMREARAMGGLEPDGESLTVYRSPIGRNMHHDPEMSFNEWKETDELPTYEDHVNGFDLEPPIDEMEGDYAGDRRMNGPQFQPDHPDFGGKSCVTVPVPGEILSKKKHEEHGIQQISKDIPKPPKSEKKKTVRRPVSQRWFYEPVVPATTNTSLDETAKERKEKEIISLDPNMEDDAFSPSPPKRLGTLKEIGQEDWDKIKDDESGACYLHGTVFLDDELGWCKINGWGVDYGITIVYYTPVSDSQETDEEHHASLASVLSSIEKSPDPPKSMKYKSSRTLRRSKRIKRKGMILRILACTPVRLSRGSMKKKTLGPIHATRMLATKTIRRILKMQESLFKYGTFIPRNDKEANASPEAIRWQSGRQLEWIRLKTAKTFEVNWTWQLIQSKFPKYKKEDIGTMFYIYDYKFSGEHRVRLVFNGAKQSPNTYTDTFAPTVRAESVRLFHIYSVEYSFHIHQFDVPQAFLRSDADCDIFVYPPRGNVEFPGQILKLSKMLYGSKQAAALWFNLLDTFLKKLGFISSYFDPCFYRRPITQNVDDPDLNQCDALIILHVDDMRVAAEPEVLKDIHDKLYSEFQITTSDTGRFLGMDTEYDITKGILKMHMSTYIETTVQRFANFDVSNGAPFRELVGSLLWVVLNIIGPELLRVKDLARRSNNFTTEDYDDAMKVLNRISERRHHGILYRRGGAGKEYVPSSCRPEGGLCKPGEYDPVLDDIPYSLGLAMTTSISDYSIGDEAEFNELDEKNLYKLNPFIDDLDRDIIKVLAPTNRRFTKVAYSDASFAVGGSKQSVTGFIVMVNGVPLLFGSLKQTVVVDSTCSAEYVAASVCCKQIVEIENMVQFLGFTCPRPYRMYTDSQACLKNCNIEYHTGQSETFGN
jgi:hypothetical protein